MHVNEWIKKYSPVNEIYRVCDVANMMNMAPNRMKYRLNVKGEVFADQKKPKLIEVK